MGEQVMKFVPISIAVVVVVAVLIWLQRLWGVRLKATVEKIMGGRPRRPGREFGEKFYPDHAEIATKVRDILADHLPIDLSRLEPSDQPVIDLKMDDMDSMSTVEFVIALEKEFAIKITNADAKKMRTFDDICTCVIARVKEKLSTQTPPSAV